MNYNKKLKKKIKNLNNYKSNIHKFQVNIIKTK